MAINFERFLRSKSFNRMHDYQSDIGLIRNVIVRRIEIKTSGNIRLYFSKCKNIDLDNYGDDIHAILRKLCLNSFRFNDKAPKMEDPYDSDLSLKNDGLSLIVYQLSGRNWQFAKDGWPLTVADKGYDKGAYFHARRVHYRSGQIEAYAGDNGDAELDDSRVAFFIADHTKANVEITGRYSDAINFHVELVFDKSGNPRRYIPLIIDPDVRYPGGSVVDP